MKQYFNFFFLTLLLATVISSTTAKAQSCVGNLITNPGFESGVINWTIHSGVTLSTNANTGTQAIYVPVGVAKGGDVAVTAVPGNRYDVRAYAKITSAVSWAGISINFYDAGWNVIESFEAQVTSTNYQEYSISAIAPMGTVHVGASFWKDNPGEFWADDFCLTTQSLGATMALGNRLFFDKDGNGIYNENIDWGLDGSNVVLYADNNNDGIADGAAIATTTTSNGGKYNFSGLVAGNYFVQIENVASWMFLSPRNGGDPDNNIENDNNGIFQNTGAGTIKGGTISLSGGGEPGGINYNSSYDIAVFKYNGLGDFVWLDNNENGMQDSGELGLAGVTVNLRNPLNNALLQSTTTDATGHYFFEDPAGIHSVTLYRIEFVSPNGYKPTNANGGGDDEKDSDAMGGIISSVTVPIGTWDNSLDAGFVMAPVVLPVKMISFNATLGSNNKVDLTWVTANEENLHHFNVERSVDGINFETVGLVFAKAQAGGSANYTFSENADGFANNSIVYYRLRSIDNDSKTQLSNTRIIRLSKENTNEIKIATYPNPVVSELRISIPTTWQNKIVVYNLVNMNGQIVRQITKAKGNQTETINLAGVQKGIYLLQVSCNDQVASQKIVKQ